MKHIPNKITWSISLILVAFVITLPFAGLYLYKYWKGFVNDDNGYNSISSVISYVGGILNIITIIFLFLNYREQRVSIVKTNHNTEYNRVLDFVYRHFEKTKGDLNELSKTRTYTDSRQIINFTLEDCNRHLSAIIRGVHPTNNIGIFIEEDINTIEHFKKYIGRLDTYVSRFDKIINIYKILIDLNNELDNNNKKLLNLIIRDLFFENELHYLHRYNQYLNTYNDKFSNLYEEFYKKKSMQNHIDNAQQLEIRIAKLSNKIDEIDDYFIV